MLAQGPAVAGAVARAREAGTLACAAQLLGAGRALLEASVSHAGQRSQFGRPIGSFQAVKHRLADVAIGLEFARPLLDAARRPRRLATPRPGMCRPPRSPAPARPSQAARAALQVHGAIGYTQEHDLHLWLTKVRALAGAWGSQAEHRARVMAGDRRWEPGMELTAERRDLRDAVRGLLARQPRAGTPESGTARLWQRLCGEIGVAGLAIPQRYGGAGAGPVETHIVMEELGRGLTCSPLLGSAVLAAQALLASGDDRGVPAPAARDRRRLRGRGPGLDNAGRPLGSRRRRVRRPPCRRRTTGC